MSHRRQVRFGPFRLDPANACLWHGSRAIGLTPRVFAVLSYLLDNTGRLVTKDELLDAVWPDTVVSEASLTVCVREIRKILGDSAREPRYIETMHRRGYRFITPIIEDGHPAALQRQRPAGSDGVEERVSGLVGREGELRRLEQWLAWALDGHRQVVLVGGEAGIGKTALVETFCRGSSTRVALGQCFQHHGQDEAYLPVLEAINRLGTEPGGDRLVALLGLHAPTWLAQLPGLSRAGGRTVAPGETLGATAGRMLREFAEAIEAYTADTPLSLVIEDLHWSDCATLDLISALARRRDPARLLLLGTYRPADVIAGAPLHSIKQDLETHRFCAELALESLNEAAVAEYLALRFPGGHLPQALARLIHERTGGNPLFMSQMVEDLVSQGVMARCGEAWMLSGAVETLASRIGFPESIRPMFERQLTRLEPDEQRTLQAASAAGLEFSAVGIAAALGEELIQVEERCERLARRQQFLSTAGVCEWPDGTVAGCYRFRHWLYQDFLYQRAPAAWRRLLHQRLGERLEAAHGDAAGELAAELAGHFEHGRDFRRAIRHLRQAAENAGRRLAVREASECLRRALHLAERLPQSDQAEARRTLLDQRGRLRRQTGDVVGAATDFGALAACAGDQTQVAVEAMLEQASVFFWADRDQCVVVAAQAAALSQNLPDPILQAHALGQESHWRLQVQGWTDHHYQAFAAAREVIEHHGDRALLGRYLTLDALHRVHQSQYREGYLAAKRGMPLTLETGDAYHYMSSYYFCAYALLHLGEWGEGLQIVRTGLSMAEQNENTLAIRVFRHMAGWYHEQAFDFEEALAWSEPGIDQTREGQYDSFYGLIRLGMVYLGLERPDSASRCFTEICQRLERGEAMDWTYYMHLHHGMSRCALAQGDLDRAERDAETTCTAAGQSGERTYLALGRQTLVEIAQARRQWERAESELAKALVIVEGGDLPLAAWRVHATAAQLHQKRRRRAAAEQSRANARGILHRLADSFGDDVNLRQSLLQRSPL